MVPDGCFENAFIDAAGADNLNGRAYVTFGGLPPAMLTGKGAEFVENYKKTYGAEPEAYAVYGYEAAQGRARRHRARAGKKDREAIRAGRRLRSRTSTARSATGRSTTTATPRSPP